jgi:hypothetical protein
MGSDLPTRVDTRIRPPCDRQVRRFTAESRQGVLEAALNRPKPGLQRPAGEVGPVVFEKEAGGQTSSRKTISVASERRGPSFRILV